MRPGPAAVYPRGMVETDTLRLTVLSDVHGNLEALKSVLADMDGMRIDDAVHLGDAVGYGPEPEAVLELLAERGIATILGNHELGLIDPLQAATFNPQALKTLTATRGLLSERAMDRIRELPRVILRHGCRFVHACPPESVNRYLYMLTPDERHSVFHGYPEELCFVGHTHELALLAHEDGRTRRAGLGLGVTRLPEGARYIINAGSVGQPRDGDNRAKYVVWEPRTRSLDVRAVAYDIAATARAITARGLPAINAERLF